MNMHTLTTYLVPIYDGRKRKPSAQGGEYKGFMFTDADFKAIHSLPAYTVRNDHGELYRNTIVSVGYTATRYTNKRGEYTNESLTTNVAFILVLGTLQDMPPASEEDSGAD